MRQLEDTYKLELTEEEEHKLKVLEKRYGMLSPQDKAGYEEYEALINKLENGTMTREEVHRFKELLEELKEELNED